MTFALKGGTSLSKGHQIIDRFSEDIDILIEPPGDRHVATGRNQNKPKHVESRKDFYDWLAKTIRIKGMTKVERDMLGAGAPVHLSGVEGTSMPQCTSAR